MVKEKKKMYVLDTNVLVHDPKALFDFGNAIVGIPVPVLEELDHFKKEGTDRGRNTREAIRLLDELRGKGSLGEGVSIAHGGIIQVLFLHKQTLETSFKSIIEDNKILSIALLQQKAGFDVHFVSKDLNARVKASALGMASEDYFKKHISESEFYHGWLREVVPAVQLKSDSPKVLHELLKHTFVPHEFVLLESQHNPYNYKVFRFVGDKGFKPVHPPALQWPLHARNPQQLMALDILLDDAVPFVSLIGPAGTGKTFLALLAGLHKVLIEDQYERILISRPVIPLGRDIGYLPGDIKEKLHNWMMPIYDNMDFIINAINTPEATYEMRLRRCEYEDQDSYIAYRKNKRQKNEKKDRRRILSIPELIHADKISLEAITYMRGRSIPYQFIIIDEAQNLTPHEVKTLITRVGAGSKIVLTGDPYQIDSPYLDFSSNGLIVASERFKGQQLSATVALKISERSELSQLASELL